MIVGLGIWVVVLLVSGTYAWFATHPKRWITQWTVTDDGWERYGQRYGPYRTRWWAERKFNWWAYRIGTHYTRILDVSGGTERTVKERVPGRRAEKQGVSK